MTRCWKHGIEYGGYDCPRCLDDDRQADAERRADERAEEAIRASELSAQAAMDAAYRIANPGDYDCPSCGFKTLKRDKPKCPMCHSEVSTKYWEHVHYKEGLAETLRAIQRKKDEAEQEAARARAQAEEKRLAPIRERERAERERRINAARRWSSITAPFCGSVFFFYFLPLLTLLSPSIIYRVFHADRLQLSDFAISDIWPFFVPLLNWLFVFFGVFLSDEHAHRWIAFASLSIWTLIGLGARVANRRASKTIG